MRYKYLAIFASIALASSCVTNRPPEAKSPPPEDQTSRGAYLVRLLSCAGCHTDGALLGHPDLDKSLAGSSIGIAWTQPTMTQGVPTPGVVFPINLTPDRETGIGDWTDEQLIVAVQTGVDPQGKHHVPVMPFPLFAGLTRDDAEAIAHYLKSLHPVKHRVPEPVPEGTVSANPFVQFGIFSWHPGAHEYERMP